jgi:hypothetical protein
VNYGCEQYQRLKQSVSDHLSAVSKEDGGKFIAVS